jgi:NADH:ubiquinone oxidoreductase subunit C
MTDYVFIYFYFEFVIIYKFSLMYKNFFFPIHLFLVLENSNVVYFISKNNYKNLYLLINYTYFILMSIILKKELFFFNTTLIESSANDLLTYKKLNNNFFEKNKNILFYNFFNYKINLNFIFFYYTNNFKTINSIDNFFKNANWLERELSEMYNIFFYLKTDSRKLLLDYSKKEAPMLKAFPVEGFSDVYFNFFDNQINFFKNETTEL